MTAPFVTQLRARGKTLQITPEGLPAITVRVELPEVWDTVRASISPDATVAELKRDALAALAPQGDPPAAYVMKLRGFEVLDENATLAAAGAIDGSIFLLTHRRRRPVR